MKNPALLSALKCAFVAVACMGGGQALAWSNTIIGGTDALFEPGSTTITPTSQAKLLQLAEQADQRGQIEVMIVVGHAETSEPDPVALSERRATAARFHMIQLGVAPRLIYTEAKGATRPLTGEAAALHRRAEVEYRGVYDRTPGTRGFRLLDTWLGIASSAAPRDTQAQDAWDAMTPLQFLPLIKDAALRARFLQKYQLLAIYRQDDGLLRQLQALASPDAVPDVLSPALMAAALGTPYAQASLAAALPRVDVRTPASRDFARALWCGAPFEWRPLIDRATMQRIRISQMLADLPPAAQQEWVVCAARRGRPEVSAEDLRFLTSHRLGLDAPGSHSRTALHEAVLSSDPTAVRALLTAGANPNAADADGKTPLHLVPSASLGPMSVAPWETKRALWDALLASGASTSIADKQGAIPILEPK